MHKFVAFPLTSASQILQLQFRIFFNFISFTMPRGEHISLSDKGGIVALRREGKSYRAIAKQYGLHFTTVGDFCHRRMKSGGDYNSAPYKNFLLCSLCVCVTTLKIF